jgi:hypothetical protein
VLAGTHTLLIYLVVYAHCECNGHTCLMFTSSYPSWFFFVLIIYQHISCLALELLFFLIHLLSFINFRGENTQYQSNAFQFHAISMSTTTSLTHASGDNGFAGSNRKKITFFVMAGEHARCTLLAWVSSGRRLCWLGEHTLWATPRSVWKWLREF